MQALLVVTALTVLYILYKIYKRSCNNLPPGPTGLPLIGYRPFLTLSNMHKQYYDLTQKYGPIFSYQNGPYLTVVLSSHAMLSEAFTKPECCQRAPYYFYRLNTYDNFSLVTFENDPRWKVTRAVLNQAMVIFMRSKDSCLPETMEEYAMIMGDVLRKTNGKAVHTLELLFKDVIAMVVQFVYGVRLEHDNKFYDIVNQYIDGYHHGYHDTLLTETIPLTSIFYKQKFDHLKELFVTFRAAVAELIDSHQPSDTIRTITDALRKSSKEVTEMKMARAELAEEQVRLIGVDLFDATVFTSVEIVEWMTLLCARYPDYQQKARDELNATFGAKNQPTYEGCKELNYLRAMLFEIFRYCSITAVALVHSTNADVVIGGYNIPKGTVLVPSTFTANHDEKVFENAMVFNPERFIANDGTFDTSLAAKVATFNFGRRMCPGDILARYEILFLLAYFIKNFKMTKEPEPRDYDPFYGKMGFTFGVPDHTVKYEVLLQH